jgi:hypothetical protein
VKDFCAISPHVPGSTSDGSRLQPRYYWIELYLETTADGYVPINVYTSSINTLTEFESQLSFPMLYVWAFDTDLHTSYAKDVTKRYSQKWTTSHYRTSHIEHKSNGDPMWYVELMQKYRPEDKTKSRHSAAENKQIEGDLTNAFRMRPHVLVFPRSTGSSADSTVEK